MGDVAEMILDGILCQVCGEYIGEAVGYPRTCDSCGGQDRESYSDDQDRESYADFVPDSPDDEPEEDDE